MTIHEMVAERTKAISEAREIVDQADRASKPLSAKDEALFQERMDRAEALEKQIDAHKKLDLRRKAEALGVDVADVRETPALSMGDTASASGGRTLRDQQTGMEMREWRHSEKMHDGNGAAIQSLAKLVRARIDGRFARDLSTEERTAYFGDDVSGGMLVPEVMSSQLIAAARDAAPVASRCNILQMPNLNTTLVGVATDPVASVSREGQTMTEGSIEFHGIKLSPHRIGTYLVLTKELAQASNAVAMISDALQYACGRALDSAILGYEDDGGIAGLKNTAGVNTRAAAGTTYTLDQMITDYYVLRSANCPEGTSLIYNSDFGESLSQRKDGEGRYILAQGAGGVPDVWNRIGKAETNIIPTATNQTDVFMGNFRFCYVGLQNNWEILVSEQTYDGTHNAFTQGKIFVRILGWADVGFGHADWFLHASGVGV